RARAAARISCELRALVEACFGERARGRRAQLELRDHVEAVERKTGRARGALCTSRELRVAFCLACDSHALAARRRHPFEERHAACSRPNATTRAIKSRPAPLASASLTLAGRGADPCAERHAACSRPSAPPRAPKSRALPRSRASRARATP